RCTPHVLAGHGLARTYQSPQLFEDMTVLETVMVGAHLRGRSGFLSTGLRFPRIAAEEREMEERAVAALRRVDFPEALYGRDALELPYGHQRRAEIARAMAMSPRALLLDEPAAGLNATETAEISELIA